ncbi:alpha/beta fold hydrolase [Sporosarcina sp. FSL K6-5500]|uniref:alpha/beta fold hydrolase n=1 Tax=Sporosarcina sp. FSL K6-5500 TaxID=2921558 RepID=UPI0030F62EEF
MDIHGFGKSSRPWDGYSYNRLADDIRIIIDILRLKNIELAGHSMGGAIARCYMTRHDGHKVSKLAHFPTNYFIVWFQEHGLKASDNAKKFSLPS